MQSSDGDRRPASGVTASLTDAEVFYDADGASIPSLEDMTPAQRVGEIRRFQTIAQVASPKRGDSVLDVGCGSGDLLATLAGCGASLCGVDLADSRLNRAAERLRTRGVDAELCKSAAESLPYPDSSFDVVVCSEILEHLPDPLIATREASRVLRPGGRYVATVPNNERIRQVPCMHCGHLSPLNGHLHTFDCASLATLCGKSGFEVSECRPMFWEPNRLPEVRSLARLMPARLWVSLDAAACRMTQSGAWAIILARKPVA